MSMTLLPLNFDEQGLIPAVIVDATTGAVLMLGFMNAPAIEVTRETGLVHFWSRSRQKLWQKGETSGHVQELVSINVNCEQNSLMIEVNQKGAVCHDGYPTCYYRQLLPDNSLSITRDRWFDPDDVYGKASGQESLTRKWWGAYEFLREEPLEGRSGTSRLLRDADDRVTPRVADELRELAGALDGTHRHVDVTSDVALEGGQVAYWIALRCIREGLTWEDVRPDRALDTNSQQSETGSATLALLLRREADLWQTTSGLELSAVAHGSLALVAEACASSGVDPKSLLVADLNELRTRSYLAPYFDREDIANG